MDEQEYAIISLKDKSGRVSVRRLSDGMTARCKSTWLAASEKPDVFVAASKVKAIRLDGLNWQKEG